MKRLNLTILSLLIVFSASAQFYVTGDDPRTKWYSIDTDNFRIIYPEGKDSLARVYGKDLETYRVPVSRTSGYLPGGLDSPTRAKMPVVLHAFNDANGSVSWAPKRMDLFTIPSAHSPEPLPWNRMLSIHESRHVSQMQFGMTKAQRPFGWIFGEMWNILVSLVYPGISNIEGDSVVAETALSASGRGRTADFLNYYWVAFDNGDFRKWDKWRFVSQKKNSPSYYALGYLTIGGFRYLYDYPQYMSDSYELSARRPYNLGSFYTTIKKKAGISFDNAFLEVCDTLYQVWKKDADARAPYISSEPVFEEPRTYTEYSSNIVVGDDIYSIKKGHVKTPSIVRIDKDGNEHHVTYFSYNAGKLHWDEKAGRILWSEVVPDERWTLQTHARIMSVEPGNLRKQTLESDISLQNPAVSSEGLTAAVRYSPEGGSELYLSSGPSFEEHEVLPAPDGLQLVETAWIGDKVYCTALSEEGYGIYSVSGGRWETVLAPQPVMIRNFQSYGDELIFTSDRTGVNELYHFSPQTGDLYQKTSTRYGASDFCYSDDGEYLYYSSQRLGGKLLFRTAADSLINRKVDLGDRYRYPLAEKLSEQERAIAAERNEEFIPDDAVNISEPKRYRKLPHMFNLHSWAPVYVNVDNIMNMSFDHIWQAASLGVTGLFQNRLATMVGQVGYSAHKDPYDKSRWRHSGHAKFTYSGLYPVIEASIDFNDRAARQSNVTLNRTEGTISITNKAMKNPYLHGSLSMYIPFNFSSGGWNRGLIPQVRYSIGNDMFDTRMTVIDVVDTGIEGGIGANIPHTSFVGATDGTNTIMHSITASVRGYTMLGIANSGVYSRWGIGAEIGVHSSLASYDYISPMGYAYLYGYVPGIIPEQGLKLTAMHQMKLDPSIRFGDALTGVLPRGYKNAYLPTALATRNDYMTKLTADYAIPIYIGDIALGGNFFSIKRLILTPHFDYTFLGNKGLYSVGSEFVIDLHSILTLEWPCAFGVTYSYNGGPSFGSLNREFGLERHFVDFVFNVSF